MLDDIDYIDDIDVSENDLVDYESEDTANFVETSFEQEDVNLLESSTSLLGLDYDSINSAESFLHHYSGSLTLDDVNASIQSASDFFNMESPMIVSEGWTTGVFNRNLTTVNDDVLIFNTDQSQSMGITEKEGLDLVMTHENTHRALQGMETGFSEHQEELCCDYMSGVRAGLNSMNTEQMVNSLANTAETITHPAGELRIEAIQEGQEFASRFLAENGHAPTFDDCLEHFKSSDAFSHTTDPLAIVPNTSHIMAKSISFEGSKDSRDIAKSELLSELKSNNIYPAAIYTDSLWGGLDYYSGNLVRDAINKARDNGTISDSTYKHLIDKLKQACYHQA